MVKKNSLLIVDDDASSLMELANILKPEYTIYAVKDGRPAIEKAHEAMPDLILLDVIMPGMNGFDVLAELKSSRKTKDIPVMFISGVNDSESESEGLSIGAVDYIRKPFDAMVVKHRVRLQIHIINLQRELESAANIAKAANESKSMFLANMSHEIRTPMNAIIGITDVLLQNDKKLSDEIVMGLSKINSASEMLLNLINDILDFSKIEAGKLDILPSIYKVANLINDSIQLYLSRFEEKAIKFNLDISNDTPAKLIGDELRIKQILNNLLSNAYKYTDTGTVTMTASYEAEPDKESITLILSVQDTGYGMSKEQLDQLFDEYTRFDETANRSIEGTGLGFPIMRRLVQLMDGDVTVESEPGKGTTVTIRMPQGRVDANVLGEEAAEELRQFRHISKNQRESGELVREPMPYGRVLVVDDTDTNLFVAVRFMEPYKLTIDTVVNGLEAVQRIESGHEYDVIFMDHMMPVMDGMEATKRLREFGYTRPIVACTANALTGQAEIFLENGFDEFISKPIDIRQLDAMLNKLIRDKQPPEVRENALQQMNKEGNNAVEFDIQLRDDPELINSFKQDVRRALGILDEILEKTGWTDDESHMQRYITAVHGVKSILACFGEQKLSDIALSLEVGGRERDTNLIKNDTPGFIIALRDVLQGLEDETENKSGGSDDDIDKLKEAFFTITEFCEDYDRKGVLDIIAGIGGCSAATSAVLDKIKEFVQHSDFDEAGEAAAEYLDKLGQGDGSSVLHADRTEDRTEEPSPCPTIPLAERVIEGLDIRKGLSRYKGDEEIYLRAMRSYSASTLSTLDELHEVDESTMTDYKIRVHGIKGASYDMNALQLGKKAEVLENAADNGDLEFIFENNPGFLDYAYKFVGEINDLIAAIDAENPKESKDKPDNVLLTKLIVACENYSMDDVDAIMSELEKYQYESDGDLIANLRRCVDLMQFPKIIKILSENDQ